MTMAEHTEKPVGTATRLLDLFGPRRQSLRQTSSRESTCTYGAQLEGTIPRLQTSATSVRRGLTDRWWSCRSTRLAALQELWGWSIVGLTDVADVSSCSSQGGTNLCCIHRSWLHRFTWQWSLTSIRSSARATRLYFLTLPRLKTHCRKVTEVSTQTPLTWETRAIRSSSKFQDDWWWSHCL